MTREYRSIDKLEGDLLTLGYSYEPVKPFVRYNSQGIGERVFGTLRAVGRIAGEVVRNLDTRLWEVKTNR